MYYITITPDSVKVIFKFKLEKFRFIFNLFYINIISLRLSSNIFEFTISRNENEINDRQRKVHEIRLHSFIFENCIRIFVSSRPT